MKKVLVAWMVFSVFGLSLALVPAKGAAGEEGAGAGTGVKMAGEAKKAGNVKAAEGTSAAAAKAGDVRATAGPKPGAVPEKEITISGEKPARFHHGIHMGLGLTCGVCHHDSKHQPLTPEAVTQAAAGGTLHCVSCHNDTFANEKLKDRKSVFHARCQECHKQGVNGKLGPIKCADCHVGQKKKLEGC